MPRWALELFVLDIEWAIESVRLPGSQPRSNFLESAVPGNLDLVLPPPQQFIPYFDRDQACRPSTVPPEHGRPAWSGQPGCPSSGDAQEWRRGGQAPPAGSRRPFWKC